MLVSTYSLFILSVSSAADFFFFLSKLRIYLDVFQNSFEFDCSLFNRCSSLSKYSSFAEVFLF